MSSTRSEKANDGEEDAIQQSRYDQHHPASLPLHFHITCGRLTPAFSGAANGIVGTIRRVLRCLRCNALLDAARQTHYLILILCVWPIHTDELTSQFL